MSDVETDEILYEENPAMFRNNPFFFILLVLIPVIGWIWLLYWWMQCLSSKLTVTNTRIIHRTGLLSKAENEVRIRHVRNVQTRQSFFQRMMNTGYIGISTAGQSGVEIAMNGMPDPDGVQELINSRIEDQDIGD
ncbi:Bacterial membrane flanked domain protein [Polystyrenella longa]|uniref:Bacterial membrane flanked domain protein n=1 Tax=Polystyrenella longa TaxID=2528007 RepID=A0A518CM29_9PLAN|nr:PH domain-containing protein [Polystyrenella longa]QDU80286.1 Bacterial membrane flanked domain protein [Polystyrenella longa]